MSDDNITKAEAIVQSDWRVTVRYVAKTIGVSYRSTETILTDSIRMNKVSARWVPTMLTPEQKKNCVHVSEELLE